MIDKEQREVWQELKELWKNSSQGEKIYFQISALVVELKSKVSQYEKDAITKDISKIIELTSDFEKDSITRDFEKITASLRKFLKRLRKKN